jgi:uncharacterized peroxidase-related enzyme
MKRGWRQAEEAGLLEPLDSALCAFAERLTKDPSSITQEDVDNLKGHGLNDRAIFDAVHVVAYYNYVNRLAEGLGVELEPYWEGPGSPEEFRSASVDLPEPEDDETP